MRDSEILRSQEAEQKRTAMIYRQLVFLDTRIQAFEEILTKRFNLLKLFASPMKFKKIVDDLQLKFMKAHDDAMRARTEKAQAEAKKPKITLLKSV